MYEFLASPSFIMYIEDRSTYIFLGDVWGGGWSYISRGWVCWLFWQILQSWVQGSFREGLRSILKS